MKKEILGKKLGMTQVFTPNGTVVPVTVVEAGPCFVTQKKTVEKDGYDALQVAFQDCKESKLSKPENGMFKKLGISAKKFVGELKLDDTSKYDVGSQILCTMFEQGDKVDVSGVSKGHGYTGNIKLWNSNRMRMTHGNGPCHRPVGSMGANTTPAHVMKNKKMPGQYGNDNVTVQNLEVVKVDEKRNVLLIKGAIPGNRGGLVVIKSTVKAE
jgi:large subunit ribosomal protein L3